MTLAVPKYQIYQYIKYEYYNFVTKIKQFAKVLSDVSVNEWSHITASVGECQGYQSVN